MSLNGNPVPATPENCKPATALGKAGIENNALWANDSAVLGEYRHFWALPKEAHRSIGAKVKLGPPRLVLDL